MENTEIRIAALAKFLKTSIEYIEETTHDDQEFETEKGTYLVLTEDEADEREDEILKQNIEELEIPENVRFYFDDDLWKRDARLEGRGHSLASDGVEHAADITIDGVEHDFYIYRTN